MNESYNENGQNQFVPLCVFGLHYIVCKVCIVYTNKKRIHVLITFMYIDTSTMQNK